MFHVDPFELNQVTHSFARTSLNTLLISSNGLQLGHMRPYHCLPHLQHRWADYGGTRLVLDKLSWLQRRSVRYSVSTPALAKYFGVESLALAGLLKLADESYL